jgi:hypothetical protein
MPGKWLECAINAAVHEDCIAVVKPLVGQTFLSAVRTGLQTGMSAPRLEIAGSCDANAAPVSDSPGLVEQHEERARKVH